MMYYRGVEVWNPDHPILLQNFCTTPFQVLAVNWLLVRSRKERVLQILDPFLTSWGYSTSFPSATVGKLQELQALIRPLGMQHKRLAGLFKLATQYRACVQIGPQDEQQFAIWLRNRPSGLPKPCGEYSREAYDIFVLGRFDIHPTDPYLRMYVEYWREQKHRPSLGFLKCLQLRQLAESDRDRSPS